MKVTPIIPRTGIERALREAEAANDQPAIDAAKRLLGLIDNSPYDYLAISKR